jgi:hypothetical protein
MAVTLRMKIVPLLVRLAPAYGISTEMYELEIKMRDSITNQEV